MYKMKSSIKTKNQGFNKFKAIVSPLEKEIESLCGRFAKISRLKNWFEPKWVHQNEHPSGLESLIK